MRHDQAPVESVHSRAVDFDADLGEKLAYEGMLKQMWPPEGYLILVRADRATS